MTVTGTRRRACDGLRGYRASGLTRRAEDAKVFSGLSRVGFTTEGTESTKVFLVSGARVFALESNANAGCLFDRYLIWH
jgi:hypothetical protein